MGLIVAAVACGPDRFYEGHQIDHALLAKAPWGSPVPQEATEQTVSTFVLGVARGEAAKLDLAAPPLKVGPSLWAALTAADGRLDGTGMQTVGIVHASHALGPMEWEMRTFRTRDGVRALLLHPAVRALVGQLLSGSVRPATTSERELFYRLTPLETAGQPLTVVEEGANRLVVYLDRGRVSWIELLSGWSVKQRPPGDGAEGPEILLKRESPRDPIDPHPRGPFNGGLFGGG